LRRALAAHRDVFLRRGPDGPVDPELDIRANEHIWLGEGWRGERAIGICRGSEEVSTAKSDEVAERLAGLAPDLRVVIALRDPVGAVVEAFERERCAGRLPRERDLMTYLEDGSDELGIVDAGRYSQALAMYGELFGDRLLVVREDDPQAFGAIAAHLGISVAEPPSVGTADEPALSIGTLATVFALVRDDVEAVERVASMDLSAWRPYARTGVPA
jgi:hypothetical protein